MNLKSATKRSLVELTVLGILTGLVLQQLPASSAQAGKVQRLTFQSGVVTVTPTARVTLTPNRTVVPTRAPAATQIPSPPAPPGVPEPGTWLLFSTGLAALAGYARMRYRKEHTA